MLSIWRKRILSVALWLPNLALATNGYFTHGVSTIEKGLAGAGVAYSQDTLAAANNPAGMVWQGQSYDFGAAVFAPMREYSVKGGPLIAAGSPCPTAPQCPFSIGDGDQRIDSDNEAFLIPQFGYNWMLDQNRSIGISVYGNGGMNTEYRGGSAVLLNPLSGNMVSLPGTYGDGTAGVDLAQLFIATTYAAKLSTQTTWGLSAIIAYQRFEAKGLGNFAGFSLNPGNLSNNGHDSATGFGLRIGIQSEVSPGLRIGAAYQPEIDMDEFDDYAGLFADDGDFNIPSNFTVGAAFDLGQNGVLMFDLQRINYEDVGAVSNSIDNLFSGCTAGATGGSGDGCLGGSNGAGFGWENIDIFKIGYQWQDGATTWRVGYSAGDQPIPSTEVVFNLLAPGVMTEHITFGFTHQLSAKHKINFAAMYAPENSVDGRSNFDSTQIVEFEMDQYELALSFHREID